MNNRSYLQDEIVGRIIDGMSSRDMHNFIADILYEQFDEYTDEQFMAEVRENYPDLIEDLDNSDED